MREGFSHDPALAALVYGYSLPIPREVLTGWTDKNGQKKRPELLMKTKGTVRHMKRLNTPGKMAKPRELRSGTTAWDHSLGGSL